MVLASSHSLHDSFLFCWEYFGGGEVVVNFVGEHEGNDFVICGEAGDGTVVFGVICWSTFMDKGGCSCGEPFWGSFGGFDYFVGGFCDCGV